MYLWKKWVNVWFFYFLWVISIKVTGRSVLFVLHVAHAVNNGVHMWKECDWLIFSSVYFSSVCVVYQILFWWTYCQAQIYQISPREGFITLSNTMTCKAVTVHGLEYFLCYLTLYHSNMWNWEISTEIIPSSVYRTWQ